MTVIRGNAVHMDHGVPFVEIGLGLHTADANDGNQLPKNTKQQEKGIVVR